MYECELELIARIQSLSEKDRDDVMKAYAFAKERHQGQTRASGEDYIVHPVGVCLILMDLGTDCVTLCAGLLHDVVEDTDTALQEIENMFGRQVAFIVDGVTKVPGDKDATHRKIVDHARSDDRTIWVKLADRLHNARTIGHKSETKRREFSEETFGFYVPLAKKAGLDGIADELSRICMSLTP